MMVLIICSTLLRSQCFSFVSRGSALSPPERIPVPRILLVCSSPSNIYLLIINIFLSILWLSFFSFLGWVPLQGTRYVFRLTPGHSALQRAETVIPLPALCLVSACPAASQIIACYF
ncbi:hypothetical protein CI102_8562 [Trichoderma harzianum]|nr:hypothetical protein CI102_8562 [Trichoderma harzianum]